MKTLAIIDLDTKRENGEAINKMVVNNSERAEIAHHYADQFSGKEQTSAFYAKMFDPELIKFDVIEDQAHEWLKQIEKHAHIFYLTSRPHTMSAETREWLKRNSISHPTIYKDYGTGETGPDGKIDNGDRFLKTPTWKKRMIQRLLDEMQPDWLIFADDEEENRRAVAEIGDPHVLIRCSLEDAATHDFQRHQEDESAPPFLRRLQELANILEEREAFETAEKWSADISHPLIPGQKQEPGMIAHIEAWNAATYAPDAEPGARFYRYSELMPVEMQGEAQLVCALQIDCDQAGHIVSVKMAKTGLALQIINELEDTFDMSREQEKAQGWADGWKAHSIEEFGYVAAARAIRGMQTIGKPALDTYLEHVLAKNEEIAAALRGHRPGAGR